jgi:hypothetical protein
MKQRSKRRRTFLLILLARLAFLLRRRRGLADWRLDGRLLGLLRGLLAVGLAEVGRRGIEMVLLVTNEAARRRVALDLQIDGMVARDLPVLWNLFGLKRGSETIFGIQRRERQS